MGETLGKVAAREEAIGGIAARIEQAKSTYPDVRIDCYVLFESHTDAMQLYELSRAHGLDVRISTTPRQARSCCGVALLVASGDASALERVALDNDAPFEDIVALPNQINPRRDVYC